MRFAEDQSSSRNRIRSYASGRITVNEAVFSRSLVVMAERIISDWEPQSFEDLTEQHFFALAELEPEILVLGTGAQLQFPPPALTVPVTTKGIGLEIMDTTAACRTYNILISEDRNVAAALLMI